MFLSRLVAYHIYFYGQIVILTAICNLWRFNMANLQLAKKLILSQNHIWSKAGWYCWYLQYQPSGLQQLWTSTRTPDLGYLASFATHFHVLWISLSSVISKPNILFPNRNILPGMREDGYSLYAGNRKNTGNYIYLTEERKWILYSHSVLLPWEALNSLPVSSLR